MAWIEAFALLPFEQPLIWLLLWPAPSLYAWAEGEGYKQLYLVNLLAGWFPPFWLFTWWLAIFPPRLERKAAKLNRPKILPRRRNLWVVFSLPSGFGI